MQKKLLLALSLFGLLAFGLLPAVPAAAGVQPQFAYFTPTPDGSGRIFYIVGDRDTCLGIELLTGVKVDQIRTLNQLDANCTIQPGQRLLLLVVEPATPEPSPVHTPPPAEPTPTTFLGNARVCILLFEDINGNATPDSGENQVSEGVISLSDRTGEVSLTGTTTNSADPLCFEDVPEGEYNLSVALPEGYNPTTAMNYALKVMPGDRSTIDFGTQLNSQANPTAPQEGGRSPLLGIIGGVMVLAGAGLGFYLWRVRR